jgi:hypothetical protein
MDIVVMRHNYQRATTELKLSNESFGLAGREAHVNFDNDSACLMADNVWNIKGKAIPVTGREGP